MITSLLTVNRLLCKTGLWDRLLMITSLLTVNRLLCKTGLWDRLLMITSLLTVNRLLYKTGLWNRMLVLYLGIWDHAQRKRQILFLCDETEPETGVMLN